MPQTVILSCHNEQSNSIKHRVMGVAKQCYMLGFSANLLARTFHFAPQPNCAVKGTKTAGCFSLRASRYGAPYLGVRLRFKQLQ